MRNRHDADNMHRKLGKVNMNNEQLMALINELFEIAEHDDADDCIVLQSRRIGVFRFEQFAERIIELETPRIRAETFNDAAKAINRRAHRYGDFQMKIKIMGCAMELLNMADEEQTK